MFKDKKIAVVVPAYNEERLIARVVETMPGFVDRIYIVDDLSGDETCARVEQLLALPTYAGKVELIRHKTNQGVGAAIVTGYRRAVDQQMDVVAVMAGDAQMDPADLELVIGPVVDEEADYVKGNRLFTGEAWEEIPRYRYLGNAVLSLLTKIASGYWHVADSQTGYTAISCATLETLPLEKLYPRYGYPNHLLVMLNVYNMRVADVPVRPVYNIGEDSGIRLHSVIPRMSWLLLRQFLWRMKEKYVIRDFHPLLFFYAFGFLLLLACAALTFRLFVLWPQYGYVPQMTALAAMFTAISGTQFVIFAMWLDMENNRNLNVVGHYDVRRRMTSNRVGSSQRRCGSAHDSGEQNREDRGEERGQATTHMAESDP